MLDTGLRQDGLKLAEARVRRSNKSTRKSLKAALLSGARA